MLSLSITDARVYYCILCTRRAQSRGSALPPQVGYVDAFGFMKYRKARKRGDEPTWIQQTTETVDCGGPEHHRLDISVDGLKWADDMAVEVGGDRAYLRPV